MKFAAIFCALIVSAAAVKRPAPKVVKPTTTAIVYKPQPTIAPPKYVCTHGDMICSANKSGFETCDNNKWVSRKCGPGTVCYTVPAVKNLLYCGYPAVYVPVPATKY